MPESNVKLTHIVYQISPENVSTECRFYNATDRSVREWMRSMRADNPDHTYIPGHVL